MAKINHIEGRIDKYMGNKYERYKFITEAELDQCDDLYEDGVVDNFKRTARLAFDLIKRYEKL